MKKIFHFTSIYPLAVAIWLMLPAASSATDSTTEVVVPRMAEPPRIEDFLDMEPPADVAEQMAAFEGFVQRDPRDGEPATQRTVVYSGYDDLHVYFVFVAYDSEPEKIRAHLTRRENISGDDLVAVYLDTFQDRRRAFVFLTNPFGVQWDALYTEGQGFDISFDTVWQSRGRLTDEGFVVWMAIPVKSLRFSPDEDQRWGLIFSREIRRGQAEESFWPPVSSRVEGILQQAATATGFEDLSPGRNLQLIPFATARSFRLLEVDGEPRFIEEDGEGDLGLDAKLVVNDRWVLDATLNPDFSQVESDEPQITVNRRFEVFFPERRPFFIENAGYFRTPLNLLFSRRIADPELGLRLTGKSGRYAVGALLIDDEAPGQRVTPDDPLTGEKALFGALRVTRDVGSQSSIGAVYVGRDLGDGFNRVAGVDGRFKISDNWVISAQAVTSSTRFEDGTELDDPAFVLSASRSGRKLNTFGRYLDVGRDFRTDAGFVPRTDLREIYQFLSYTFRPEGRRLISWGFEFEVRRNWDHDGLRLDQETEGSVEWWFTGSTGVELNYGFGDERLRPGDVPGLLVDRDFDFENWALEYQTAFSDRFDIDGDLRWGKTVNFSPAPGAPPTSADYLESEIDFNLRPFTRLKIDNTSQLTELETPSGARIFRQNLLRSRWNYQFTRRASLRLILQYISTDAEASLTSIGSRETWNGDLLFTYRINPWRALFVGTNSNYQDLAFEERDGGRALVRTGSSLINDARQVFVKYSHLIRF